MDHTSNYRVKDTGDTLRTIEKVLLRPPTEQHIHFELVNYELENLFG